MLTIDQYDNITRVYTSLYFSLRKDNKSDQGKQLLATREMSRIGHIIQRRKNERYLYVND